MTHTMKNHSFTTERGNRVEVFNVKAVGTANGFTGFGQTVRTFAVVNGEHEVECEARAAFTAWQRVRNAGF
jgi:hypothetical protein